MALGALIAAVRDADDGSGLVSALVVCGRTLIERQARLAARAGAGHVVILVERLPGALTGAIDRLRRDGIAVDVARSAADAADRFHPDERVLVLADGALVEPATLARLGAASAPALLTLGESGAPGPFERIDAATRWAGIALVSGDMLRRTVAMLGDWDLHSTLLRRAVGASARRVDVAEGAGLAEPAPPIIVRSRAGAHLATQTALGRAGDRRGWPARFLYGPVARAIAGSFVDRLPQARWLRWGAIAMAVAGAACAAHGWLLAALVLLILSAGGDTLGGLLAGLRLSKPAGADRLATVRAGVIGVGLLLFGWHRLDLGWGALALAAFVVAAAAALGREAGTARGLGLALPDALADADALVLLAIPFAAAHAVVPGLAALAAYAALSFAIVQHRVAGHLGARHLGGGHLGAGRPAAGRVGARQD